MKVNFKVKGNGTSLWGKSDDIYDINKIELNYHDSEEESPTFAEIQMFGKNTNWYQYTDEGIAKLVNKKDIMDVCKKLIEKVGGNPKKKWKLCWSEQGMQPETGWSFDFYWD
jgi:hypothetical protein